MARPRHQLGGEVITGETSYSILLSPASFKGSLSAIAVAESMRDAVLELFPLARVRMLPVSDGGEGIVDILLSARGGTRVEMDVQGPLPGRKVRAVYGITDGGKTALIEMAQAAGLTLIPARQRDPKITTTYGVGELIRDALKRGVTAMVLGIGGSGTNDGGAGMAEALGVRLLDRDGGEIPRGGAALVDLADIDLAGLDERLTSVSVTVACDVRNPLVGPLGATAVFGPQKGATAEDIRILDRALSRFREVVLTRTGIDVQALPGSGAAGGLGAGLAAFCHASLKSGIELVLDTIGFDLALQEADLVITGEGRLDQQTAFGKSPGGVLARAHRAGKPALAVVGSLYGDRRQYLGPEGFADVIALAEGSVDTQAAIAQAGRLVRQRTQELLTRFVKRARPHQGGEEAFSGKD